MDERLRRSAAHLFVDDLDVPVPAEADWHHLRRVLRLRDGEQVSVSNGAGRWRPCELRGDAVQAVGPVADPAAAPTTVVAAAIPKGDRLEWLVAKCTELGVGTIVLLETERSVVRVHADKLTRQMERLRRIAREAAMQSRRLWLPVIAAPTSLAELLAECPDAVVAEPGGRRLGVADRAVAIGPEGGWTDAELALVGADRRVALGGGVLRVETAAVAAAAIFGALVDPVPGGDVAGAAI